MSRKQKPRPHYEQGPPLSPPPLWRPLGVPQCTFLYPGVFPSVYPGVYPSVYPGKPWYTGLPAPIMKISQRISSRPGPQICLCWWRSGQNNIWSDQQSRCYSTSDLVPEIFVEKEMIPPPVLPLGDPPFSCGPFTRRTRSNSNGNSTRSNSNSNSRRSNRCGFSELLLLRTFMSGLEVGHGAQFLLAATKRKVWGNHNSEQI